MRIVLFFCLVCFLQPLADTIVLEFKALIYVRNSFDRNLVSFICLTSTVSGSSSAHGEGTPSEFE